MRSLGTFRQRDEMARHQSQRSGMAAGGRGRRDVYGDPRCHHYRSSRPANRGVVSGRRVDVSVAISAYLVTVAVLIPASGWMADRFGVGRVFVAAIAIFTLASVGCAASVSLPMLVIMRVFQGLGGALMVPVGRLAVLRDSDKTDLVRAIALLTWPALAAPVVAPALGGAIATVAS